MSLNCHILPDSCVGIRFKMLTYFVYAPLLKRIAPFELLNLLDQEVKSRVAGVLEQNLTV